jgi:hypothetical protein
MPVGLGPGLEDVGVEGDAVDDGGDEAGAVMTWPHSLNDKFDATATEAFSSRSVRTWNSNSAPRVSTWT